MSSKKHIPLRTCVACRRVAPQPELVRIVRTGEGRVEVDPGGRKPGRGAYLCPAPPCWEAGIKGGKLERALKTVMQSDDREELRGYGERRSDEQTISR